MSEVHNFVISHGPDVVNLIAVDVLGDMVWAVSLPSDKIGELVSVAQRAKKHVDTMRALADEQSS